MNQKNITIVSLLALTTSLSQGCAEDPNAAMESASDQEDTVEALASADGGAATRIESALCDPQRPGTCSPTRATPEQNRIWVKIAALPADVRAAYYQTPTTGVWTTPDGNSTFQWYTGTRGRGSVYNINDLTPGSGECPRTHGTLAIYGAIAEAWGAAGYERGIGYPTNERSALTTGSQSFQCTGYLPTPENRGLAKQIIRITDNGSSVGTRQTVSYYQVGSDRNALTTTPQTCSYDTITYPIGTVQASLWPEGASVLWCGPKPWLNPGYQSPPGPVNP